MPSAAADAGHTVEVLFLEASDERSPRYHEAVAGIRGR